jgi:hypothetical protein
MATTSKTTKATRSIGRRYVVVDGGGLILLRNSTWASLHHVSICPSFPPVLVFRTAAAARYAIRHWPRDMGHEVWSV